MAEYNAKNYAEFLMKNYDDVLEDAVKHTQLEDVIVAHGESFLEDTREHLKIMVEPIGDVKAEGAKPLSKTVNRRK